MSRKRIKQYLMLLTAVGVIAVAANGAGTFASFSAETTNAGNSFATGTLILKNTDASANICYSNEGAANARGCSAVVTGTDLRPGTPVSNTLTIKNEGTLASKNLLLYLPDTQTVVDGAHGDTVNCVNTTTGTFPGSDALAHTGDVCGNIKISVETDSSGTATACPLGVEKSVSDHACDPTQGFSLSDYFGAGAAKDFGALTAGASQDFTVYLYLPDTAGIDNTFQGRTATFDLTWHIDQVTS
jgi:hypothetical protein